MHATLTLYTFSGVAAPVLARVRQPTRVLVGPGLPCLGGALETGEDVRTEREGDPDEHREPNDAESDQRFSLEACQAI